MSNNAFTYTCFEKCEEDGIPFWHSHPYIELGFIEKGNGMRHVGQSVSYFLDGDLVMIGPNVPHIGYQHRLYNKQGEINVEIPKETLQNEFWKLSECTAIRRLFAESRYGITFQGNTKRWVGERLIEMNFSDSFEKMTTMLRILQRLAKTDEKVLLNAIDYEKEVLTQDDDPRLYDVYNYVETHYVSDILLSEVAAQVSMTVPGFCRFFKKGTGMTFTYYLNKYRIQYACKELLENPLKSIADIGFDCGYNNFSYFNRSFKKHMGETPSAYRKRHFKSLQ